MKLRPPRFTLRVLLAVVTLVALLAAWRKSVVDAHVSAVSKLPEDVWVVEWYENPHARTTQQIFDRCFGHPEEMGGGFFSLREPYLIDCGGKLNLEDVTRMHSIIGIRTLVMHDVHITDWSTDVLCGFSDLEYLHIHAGYLPYTERTISDLSKLKNLKGLGILARTQPDEAFMTRLKDRLKDCDIAVLDAY